MAQPSRRFNPEAETRRRQIIRDIHRSLSIIATELANNDGSDAVNSVHLDEARKLLSPQRGQRRAQEIGKLIGGAFFGAFVPGFYTSLPLDGAPGNANALIFYTALGIAGILITVYASR